MYTSTTTTLSNKPRREADVYVHRHIHMCPHAAEQLWALSLIVFKLGFKSVRCRLFSNCRRYIIPDVTVLNWQNRLSRNGELWRTFITVGGNNAPPSSWASISLNVSSIVKMKYWPLVVAVIKLVLF